MQRVRLLTIDSALDTYNVNASRFIVEVEELYATYQKPIWVTEWACHDHIEDKPQCSMDDMIVYMNVTQQFLDETEYVERYAWFGVPSIINPVRLLHIVPTYP